MFQLPAISLEIRAAARLASGQTVWLRQGSNYFWMLGAEGAIPNSLPGMGGKLYITAERASSLGAPVATPLAELRLPSRADTLAALINPLRLSDSELLADFEVSPVAALNPANEAMPLIKHAGLLPALILGPAVQHPPLDALIYDLSDTEPKVKLNRVSQSHLPLHPAPDTEVITFHDGHGLTHLALIVGNPDLKNSPLVRLHSSCLTGDILGSMRCDCGDQLRGALSKMQNENGGVVLYLDQEGRGIGLANKLRAYQLQDNGMDTYAANRALGFKDDERDFTLAAAILQDLGITSLRLLTNNPSKVDQLKNLGITVTERVPLVMQSNPHNADYLEAKGTKGKHILPRSQNKPANESKPKKTH
jgi:GTP cyclohydrolase II